MTLNNPIAHTYEKLRDKIVAGEYYPSQRLVESRLAKELDSSRHHIRMAFQWLAADGLVTLHPNQGAVVSEVSLPDILDVLVAREALELEAFRRAFDRMTDEGLAELEALVNQMQQALEEQDFELYSDSSIQFRSVVLDISASPRIRELSDSMRLNTRRIRQIKIVIPLRGKSTLSEHERLLAAFKHRDKQGLETAFREHMENVRKDTEKHWNLIKP